eukprot:TRINITY_DN2232_c0_g4_i2.p1 TRINITY_DN2232_c0_g4~~TRINITY_DN2232_c0_g4_i2.p1  ORF type:complete len:148 (-),score=9.02 TRINITY_DN2232_c0_g4_i2:121-564(-)
MNFLNQSLLHTPIGYNLSSLPAEVQSKETAASLLTDPALETPALMPTPAVLPLPAPEMTVVSVLPEALEPRPLPKEMRKLIKAMKVGSTKKECSICVSGFASGEVIRELPCKHIFHHDCLKPWFASNSSCPNCRYDIHAHFHKAKMT